MLARKALAGTAAAPKVYVEDVFSTYLYTGNGSTQTITNNIDLSGEGGLVWTKARVTAGFGNELTDTVRGAGLRLISNTTGAQGGAGSSDTTGFTSSGFQLTYNNGLGNLNNENYVSWTFRKAEKFFDVVTWTGDGTSGRSISHSLGSTPGCIIIKRYDSGSFSWLIFHRSLQDGLTGSRLLFDTAAATNGLSGVNIQAADATTITLGSVSTNTNGGSFVAYLFAHDAGGFGDAGSDSIIKCGSFTATSGTFTDLGWEPQWLLAKNITAENSWSIVDNMRGVATNQNDSYLLANTSGAEVSNSDVFDFNAKGFTVKFTSATDTYIYIAIRRGPMKTPTTGTSVFNVETLGQSSGGVTPGFRSGWPVDMNIVCNKSDVHDTNIADRMRGRNVSYTNLTSAETSNASWKWDQQLGIYDSTATSTDVLGYMFRRAPGFFDVVCYTGTGANRTVSHNLGVAPELMIVKNRSTTGAWHVYSSTLGNTKFLELNTNYVATTSSDAWNDTSPTSSVFTVGVASGTNGSGNNLVAYLFASLSGVSKIGTYTGNGSSVTVTTDFQPRFILVRRNANNSDWIVSDSARGLVAGNDPYLELNTTDAEVTNEDWVDISSTSFTVNQTTNNANVNTGTYIYLAIA